MYEFISMYIYLSFQKIDYAVIIKSATVGYLLFPKFIFLYNFVYIYASRYEHMCTENRLFCLV